MALDEVLLEDEWMIAAIVSNGHCLARKYIESLQESDRKRVNALIKRCAEHGSPNNREKNKKIDGDLWELKSYQARLPFFRDGPQRIVITHGFTKKTDDIPPSEITRAKRLMDDYRRDRRRQR